MVAALLIGLAAAAAAQPPAAQSPGQTPVAAAQDDGPAIVVTGERLRDLRRALADCLARNCPPNEDVDATLAVAEGEFLNGDYDRAEQAIQASVSRNRRHRRAYPEPVADLFRSQARVQSHRGRDRLATQSTYEILRTLRAGIPQEDHRHFTARMEIVQAELKTANRNGVIRELNELITAARKAGRDDVARRAEMRRLQFSYAITPYGLPLKRLQALAASTDPSQAFERVSARFFLSRVYRGEGKIEQADAMLAGIPKSDTDSRTLLYAPRIRLTAAEADPSMLPGMRADHFVDTWIDVAYWIRADGGVENVEVVRKGANADWADPVLASIRKRLYSASTDASASYRLERYTYTAERGTRTGSRLTGHVGRPRVEYLDLTARDEPGREVPEMGVPSAKPGPGGSITQ